MATIELGPIQRFIQSGVLDMADPQDRYNAVGRFFLSSERWALVYFKAAFGHSDDGIGAVATTANDLTVRIDHASRISNLGGDGAAGTDELQRWHFLIHTALQLGAGAGSADYFYRLTDDEILAHTMRDGDQVIFLWTNPDNGNGRQRWDLEVGLAEVF